MAARRWKAASKARTREATANIPSLATIGLLEIEEAEKDIVKEIQNHYGQEIDELTKQGHALLPFLCPHNPFAPTIHSSTTTGY